jgi:hypothetical protein
MKILMLLRLVCAVLCVLPWVAKGSTVNDGERVSVTLSQGAMNQLRITADRIQTVRGIPIGVEVILDPLLGDAYLTVNTEKPFTAFITTEKKQRYVLDCLPLHDVPSQVIVIDTPLLGASTAHDDGQKNIILALLHDLRHATSILPGKQKMGVDYESPKRHMASRVMLLEKQQDMLVGRVYWVKSFKVFAKYTSENDHWIARIISPVSRRSQTALYVYEVSHV